MARSLVPEGHWVVDERNTHGHSGLVGIADAPVDSVGAIWLVGMIDVLQLVDAADTSSPLQLSVVDYLHQTSCWIHCLA